MKTKKYIAIVLTLILLINAGGVGALASGRDILLKDAIDFDSKPRSNVALNNGIITDVAYFSDAVGATGYVKKEVFPDNTFIITAVIGSEIITIPGEINYEMALNTYGYARQTRANTYVYLGSKTNYCQVGPTYGSISSAAAIVAFYAPWAPARYIATVISFLTSAANSPKTFWVKEYVTTYEVHGSGGIGFLGWYHMASSSYYYETSDTSGSNYVFSGSYEYDNTMPG